MDTPEQLPLIHYDNSIEGIERRIVMIRPDFEHLSYETNRLYDMIMKKLPYENIAAQTRLVKEFKRYLETRPPQP